MLKYQIVIAIFIIHFTTISAHDRKAFVNAEYSVIRNNNIRLSFEGAGGLSDGAALSFALLSVAMFKDNENSKYFISSNALFAGAAGLSMLIFGEKTVSIPMLLLSPILISNIRFSRPIIPNYLDINFQQKTDYFLFYSNSEVYTTTIIGFEGYIHKVGITFSVNYPWSKKYYGDKIDRNLFISCGVRIQTEGER